jgi:hypothetical protein
LPKALHFQLGILYPKLAFSGPDKVRLVPDKGPGVTLEEEEEEARREVDQLLEEKVETLLLLLWDVVGHLK